MLQGQRRPTYIVAGEVAALEHEVGDDAMEDAALVVLAVGCALADLGEVLGRLGDNVIEEDEVDAPGALCDESEWTCDDQAAYALRRRPCG